MFVSEMMFGKILLLLNASFQGVCVWGGGGGVYALVLSEVRGGWEASGPRTRKPVHDCSGVIGVGQMALVWDN